MQIILKGCNCFIWKSNSVMSAIVLLRHINIERGELENGRLSQWSPKILQN